MPGRYTHPMFSLTSGRLSKRCFCRIGRWYFSTSPTQEFFIHEVTPRDGLQNESAVLDVDQKLQLIQGLVQTNPGSIEVCSFVREDRVPAMKGSQELVRRMNEEQWALDAKRAGMNFAALVPNHRGFDTFQNTAGDILDTVVVLTSCTDSHSKANVGLPLAEALDTSCGIIRNALAAGFRVVAFVSLAFGCPFEGAVDPKVVKDIVEAYNEQSVSRIVLADTQGVGKPWQVEELLGPEIICPSISRDKIGMHMHDTHRMAHVNIFAGMRAGIRHFDSATGGCGGCNFAPGALGNIATQKLLRAIEEEHVVESRDDAIRLHGMDHVALKKVHEYLEVNLGSKLPFEYDVGVLEMFDTDHLLDGANK